MNEAETRTQLILPKLKASGWGEVPSSYIREEYRITQGRIHAGGVRGKAEIADYVLVYKNQKVAVIEAKQENLHPNEGVAQAKTYANLLGIEFAYATNGHQLYEISLKTGKEWFPERFPTPDELWMAINTDQNQWKEHFAKVPFENPFGHDIRYYQEIAVRNVLNAVAENKQRILLTMATGTGKTSVAFHVAWKLFQSRWNLSRDGGRRPRILFLADRNILADQAFNSFSKFPEDALVRINPLDIRKKGSVPTNGSIFFTIFQTFMSGPKNTPYFGDYPPDFFDFVIVDECHRGGANDEGNWRGILEYFSPAFQLGLTATPKRKDNVDTYAYFGEPVYVYSLKTGINDGFLTPFKVKRIKTTIDDYVFTPDDHVVEGEVEQGKVYEEEDFNKIIEIEERERKRIKVFLDQVNQSEKSIVFCANQAHARLIRDLINQEKNSADPFYCVRVTANEGERGEQYLREFQDNEKTIPTILTTSQKLSTGVDARNVRNIALMRPIKSMIEFKQIIGRGTRLYDGKDFFTIYDFVDAYVHFSDPEWDGEPILEVCRKCNQNPCVCETIESPQCPACGQKPCVCPKPLQMCEICGQDPCDCEKPPKKMLKIHLGDGKEREIQHMISTSFWSADGKPISSEEFINNVYGTLPDLFNSEEELRSIWSNPVTRKQFLKRLFDLGLDVSQLENIHRVINAQDCDLFDVLSYIAFQKPLITRSQRVKQNKEDIFEKLSDKEKDFLDFVLQNYEKNGYEELDEEKLPVLLNLKYHSPADAINVLGSVEEIRSMFSQMQQGLYASRDSE